MGQPDPVPDGTAAVVPVTRYDDDGEGSSRIWLVDVAGSTMPLTGEARSADKPVVSPDGIRIAFVATSRGSSEPAQAHIISLTGGEAEQVADLPLGVQSIRWLPDNSGLVVSSRLYRDHPTVEGSAEEHDRRRDQKRRPVVTEDRVFRFWKRWLAGETLDHLFRIDLATDEITHLTPGLTRPIALDDDPDGLFDVSPDGASVAVAIDVHPDPWNRFEFSIHLISTSDGTARRVDDRRPGQCRRPRFSPDGTTIVYGYQADPLFYADRVTLIAHNLETDSESDLTKQWDRSAAGWEFAASDRLVFSAETEGRQHLYTIGLEGGEPTQLTTGRNDHGPRPAGGTVWHRRESAESPPRLAVTNAEGTSLVGDFNADLLSELELGQFETIEVDGAQGDPIQVQITYPPDFDPSRPWPLLQNVHGGPHNASLDSWHWRWNTQVMAAAGYVVSSVNFHGSSSWGSDFTDSIRGAWGDMPTSDVLAATQHLANLDHIDETRIAAAGGSYGGYLVAWLTTISDGFRCAIVHAGVNDLLLQYSADVTAGREQSIGGVPWEDMDAVLEWSPTANTAKLATPTLVIHGELDYRVPIDQGLVWYGILKAKGVEARLVYYSDEGHWIEKRDNALVWWDEFLGWLDRHME